ncbi:MAG: alcohol dehydrogenase catalytic domain-containing protein [Pirellulales bacterium]|nr:alcohol dehydrogenase catalytic domain-containing protein [Pirellulales bacterium]
MKAVVWTGEQTFQLQDVPEPRPESGQVVVKVEAAAICGTDLHYADFQSTPPIIPGHEVAGIVVEKATDVNNFSIGDAVALDPVQRCGECYACASDFAHLCLNTRHLGSKCAPGGWAEYVAVDAANAYRIPEGVSFASAALAEPAAVCYQSFRRARLQAGQNVLIIGDGPFGLLHAAIARILGAKTIIVAGHYDERLARIVGHTRAISCNTHREDLGAVVAERTGGLGMDVAVDATGAGATPNIAISALRPRGTLVIFSYIWNPQPTDFPAVHLNELNLVGSCRSLGCFEPCLQWMAEDKLPAEDAVDLQIPLQHVNDAISELAQHKKDLFKAVLLPGRK